jgi:hypothetical protein
MFILQYLYQPKYFLPYSGQVTGDLDRCSERRNLDFIQEASACLSVYRLMKSKSNDTSDLILKKYFKVAHYTYKL